MHLQNFLKLSSSAIVLLLLSLTPIAYAQEAENTEVSGNGGNQKETNTNGEVKATTGAPTSSTARSSSSRPTPKYPPHTQVLKDTKATPGLITTYRKGNRMFFELTGAHYNREFIVLISIAKGMGRGDVIGGMSWGFGDDWIWTFRKVDDNVHIVRKNVRFRAKSGTPEAAAVKKAYSDSVLYSLPIRTKGPRGGDIIDVSSVFMSDLPQISRSLPGFGFSPSKSTWASVKGFPKNIELQVAATYASGGYARIDSVADSRGVTVNVHYSISSLPKTGYTPRLADDRIGYFLTVVKDYSKKGERDRFIRYINRWNLKKKDSSLKRSPPVKPIRFYLEKTVPVMYRQPIKEGILEWNKAFDKLGFVDAIDVDQQEESDTWDPEDINYNTFRWITSSAGFAMGPSRVNPYNGQILDADIIFDADFLQSWKAEFEIFSAKSIASMTGGPLDLVGLKKPGQTEFVEEHYHIHEGEHHNCRLAHGMSHQLAFASSAIMAKADPKADAKENAELLEKLIMQGLKEVTMHEVGHTLGLRHNFKGSILYSLEDLNNPEKTKETGLVASVMDYSPANIVPKGKKQGDFYTTTIGPYDYWAIEYGYGSKGSKTDLQKIASRSGEPGLAYATDEDARYTSSPDPDADLFDLGNNSLEYARQQAELVNQIMPNILDRSVKKGEGYEHARRTFNVLLGTHGMAMYAASRSVGGIRVNRSHKGDKDAKDPFEVVDPKQQREALALIEQEVFSKDAYKLSPEVLNKLATSRWNHWGSSRPLRPDYPIHDYISMWQSQMLYQLLSSSTLTRIHDTELKIPADQDAFTTAELLERLTKAVYSETESIKEGEFTNRKPAISSLRRNLQRNYLRLISYIAMGQTFAPDDCQTVAFAELGSLEARISNLLKSNVKLDSYSRAHLQETASRIQKVRDAKLTLYGP